MSATVAMENMRQRAEWMVPADDPILETFRDRGNLTPRALSREGRVARVDIGGQHASNRCRALWRRGILVMVDDSLYALSDDGRAYLDEQLDASTLDELDEPLVADE